jgi:hypothetical protein
MMTSFPALDEEPPPPSLRSRLRRMIIALVAVVVLAGAGFGSWAIYNSVSGGDSNASNRLLVLTGAKFLATAQPDGSAVKQFAQFGLIGGSTGYVSPGGRTLLTNTGDTVVLRDGKPVSHSTALYAPFAATSIVKNTGGGVYDSPVGIFTLAPFADRGADVVFSTPELLPNGTPGSRQAVSIVATNGGKARSLGVVDDYVGDPQQAAAFVSVPAAGQADSSGNLADTAIEHRVAGGPTSTVITTTQVAKDLGLAEVPQMSLGPLPDPSGKELAVVARHPWGEPLGLLVYTRTGQLVAHTNAAPAGPLNWNPVGSKLLFDTGHGAAVWTPGGGTQIIATPADASLIQSCVWSPDGNQTVCLGYPGQEQRYDVWVDFDLAKGTARTYPQAGIPLLWLK